MKKILLFLVPIFTCFIENSYSQATACTPTYGSLCSSGDYLDGFVTTGGTTNISNNNSGCNGNTNNYIFYGATHKHTAMAGSTVNFTIYNCPSWSQGYKIWVDWNDNGLFSDAGDLVYNPASTLAGSMSASSSFIIPLTTSPGIKRMRVRGVYSTTTFTDCDNQSFGETEDYQLVVMSNSCTGTPTAGTLKAKFGSVICGSADSLYLENPTMGQGITYTWQMQNGASWSTLGVDTHFRWSPIITQNKNFRVIVTCTNSGGGSATSNIKLITKEDPTINLGPDTTICINHVLPLQANLQNAATYLWSNNQTSQTINVTNPGTYSVRVTQTNGCIARDTIIVTAGEEVVNNIATSLYMCSDSFLIIDAGNPGSFYNWSNNSKTQTIVVTNPGAYSVVVTSPDSCKLTSNTNVTLNPRPTFPLLVDSYTICNDDSILLNAVSPVGYYYDWSTGANTSSIYAKDSGNYHIRVMSDKGCPSDKDIQLNWYRDPEVKGFTYIPKFFEGFGKVEFAPIGATAVNTYHWDFGDGNTSNNAYPTHKYDSIGSYNVVLTVINHCDSNSYGQLINIKPSDINKINNTSGLLIYPNPSIGQLVIEHEERLQLSKIEILDIAGKLVFAKEVKQAKVELDLEHLTSGLYLIKVEDQNGNQGVHKIEIIK